VKTLAKQIAEAKKKGVKYVPVVREGYIIKPCRSCGELVVHSIRLQEALSMHRYSDKCKKLAEKNRVNQTTR
jgi:hypothetical protein